MKTETMKRDVCYLCDKNTKMKTTEFDIDKIFQISCKIAQYFKIQCAWLHRMIAPTSEDHEEEVDTDEENQ